MQSANEPHHQHQHQTVPSDMTLRVKVARIVIDRERTCGSCRTRCVSGHLRKQSRTAQRREDRGAGLDRPDVQEASADRRAQGASPNSVTWARKASTWWSWRTLRKCITLWSARLCSCYPWPVLGLPPVWYKSLLIVRDLSSTRAAFCGSSVLSFPKMSRYACGIVRPNCAIWFLPERPSGTGYMDERNSRRW